MLSEEQINKILRGLRDDELRRSAYCRGVRHVLEGKPAETNSVPDYFLGRKEGRLIAARERLADAVAAMLAARGRERTELRHQVARLRRELDEHCRAVQPKPSCLLRPEPITAADMQALRQHQAKRGERRAA